MSQKLVAVFDSIDESLTGKQPNVEECWTMDNEALPAAPDDVSVIRS